MPGAVPITSTYALTNATLPYVLALADHGVAGGDRARSRACGPGVNVAGGRVTHAAVAEGTGMEFTPLEDVDLSPDLRLRRPTWQPQQKTKLQNFIGGEFVDPADGATEEVLNPATGEAIAEAPLSGEEDVNRAVAAAARRVRGLGRHHARRALAGAAQAGRRDRGARRRDRRPRVGQRRQAAPARSSRTRSRSWWTTCASSPAPRATWRARRPGEYIEGYTSIIRREPIGVVGQITPVELPADDGACGRSARRWPRATRSCSSRPRPRRSRTLKLAELAADIFPDGRAQRDHRPRRARRARRS